MIIKTFTAETSAQALKKVREEMGGEAIVLKTTETSDSNNIPIFEVTACLEKPTVAQSSKILSEATKVTKVKQTEKNRLAPHTVSHNTFNRLDNWQQKIFDIDKKLNQIIDRYESTSEHEKYGDFEDIYSRLKEADFLDSFLSLFMNRIISEYDNSSDNLSYVRERLVKHLSSFMVPDIKFEAGDKVVFIGPAGSGKSSALGKLAVSLVTRQKQKVKLVTLDDFKMTAFDEIATYGEILGAEVVEPSVSMKKIKNDKNVITLIDTPAIGSKGQQWENMKKKIDSIQPDFCFVVLSSLIRSSDIGNISKPLEALKPTHLIMSMTDLTGSFGVFATASEALKLQIAFVTDTPGGIGALHTPDPDLIARQILNGEVISE
ncbi:MAG: hypothetical protein GXO93_02225 [FCB group bacterium]|nr:hypothetical protein [FCB group bacterium]